MGWDVSPKQKNLDDALTKWREEVDQSGRALREAESERQSYGANSGPVLNCRHRQ